MNDVSCVTRNHNSSFLAYKYVFFSLTLYATDLCETRKVYKETRFQGYQRVILYIYNERTSSLGTIKKCVRMLKAKIVGALYDAQEEMEFSHLHLTPRGEWMDREDVKSVVSILAPSLKKKKRFSHVRSNIDRSSVTRTRLHFVVFLVLSLKIPSRLGLNSCTLRDC